MVVFLGGMWRRMAWAMAPVVAAVSCAGCLLLTGGSQEASQPAKPAAQKAEPWILIDSRTETLTVYRDGESAVVFGNLAFGAAGVKEKRRAGDDVTPRGSYKVGWITHKSKFVHFIGITYPGLEDAERGLRDGTISRTTYSRIERALQQGDVPPQDTPLGGLIGIHGVGKGSLEIHRIANWTAGCIAIENRDIRKLSRLVKPGMRVEIQ